MSIAVLVVIWLIATYSLGARAATVYLRPFAWSFYGWLFRSIAFGCVLYLFYQGIHSIHLRIRKQSSLEKAEKDEIEIKSSWPKIRETQWIWVLFGAAILGGIQILEYNFHIGVPYQTVAFPGTKHPIIEIRYSGFADQNAHAFLVGPVYRQEILDLPWSLTYRTPTNPPSEWGEGEVKMAMSHFDPYAIRWLKNENRFVVSIAGANVATYNLNSGERTERKIPVNREKQK